MDVSATLPGSDVVGELLAVARRRRNDAGETKVAKLELIAPGVDEQVLRLYVSMNHPVVVAPINRSAQLVDVSERGSERTREATLVLGHLPVAVLIYSLETQMSRGAGKTASSTKPRT